MTVGVDTNRIHSETYKEYSKHEHTCSSYVEFLLVEIMRLERELWKSMDREYALDNNLRVCQEDLSRTKDGEQYWIEKYEEKCADIEDMAGGGY